MQRKANADYGMHSKVHTQALKSWCQPWSLIPWLSQLVADNALHWHMVMTNA